MDSRLAEWIGTVVVEWKPIIEHQWVLKCSYNRYVSYILCSYNMFPLYY